MGRSSCKGDKITYHPLKNNMLPFYKMIKNHICGVPILNCLSWCFSCASVSWMAWIPRWCEVRSIWHRALEHLASKFGVGNSKPHISDSWSELVTTWYGCFFCDKYLGSLLVTEKYHFVYFWNLFCVPYCIPNMSQWILIPSKRKKEKEKKKTETDEWFKTFSRAGWLHVIVACCYFIISWTCTGWQRGKIWVIWQRSCDEIVSYGLWSCSLMPLLWLYN